MPADHPLPRCGRDSGVPVTQQCCSCCEELRAIREHWNMLQQLFAGTSRDSITGEAPCRSPPHDMYLLDPDQQSQSVLPIEVAKARGVYTSPYVLVACHPG